jgi:hypothetical protein
MTTNYFSVANLPLLDQAFVDEALSTNYVTPGPQGSGISPDNRIGTAPSSFVETDFYKDLQRELNAIEVVYLKFPGNMCFSWHTDNHRNCCINFTMDNYPNSYTLFRQPILGLEYSVERLDYVAKQPTILNNNVEHSVINLDNSARYILSIGFATSTSFDDLKNYLTSLNITSYT